MTDAESRRQFAQAHDRGRQSRSGGKPITDNPFRGHTKLVRDLHEQWALGWHARDSEIRGEKRR